MNYKQKQELKKAQRVNNAEKLIARFKGKSNEWGMLWGVLLAGMELPDLEEFYDGATIAGRIDALKAEMFAAYKEDQQ